MKSYPLLACVCFSLVLSACQSPQSAGLPGASDTAQGGANASPSTAPPIKGSTGEDAGSPPEGQTPTTGATPGSPGTTQPPTSGEPVAPVSTAFQLGVNGFKFENYGKVEGVQDLTAVEMRRLFGDGVVASMAGDQPVLTPPAQKWMEETNQSMSGGHCEGMAVLSLLMYTGQKKVSDFGSVDKAHDLELTGNALLQREIAYWFALQGLDPTAGSETKNMTPNQVLARLAEGLKPGATDTYTLGFYKPGYKEGHAVMPYAIADGGGSVRKIMVYDNNYPGVAKELMVDTATGKWTYSGSTNPSVAGSEYAGDDTTKTLTITPISERMKPQKAPFLGDMVAGEAPKTSLPRQVFVQGQSDALIDDGQGHQIGTKNGQLVNTMPDAKQVAFKSAFNNDPKAAYHVPGGSDLNITLGGGTAGKAAQEVTLVGPGYDFAVEDITLDPGQTDKIWMSASGRELRYTTTAKETPELSLGLQAAGADYAFAIIAGGDEDGHSVTLKLDQATGKLGLSTAGVQGASGFDILVYRIDEKGSHEFKNFGNGLEAGQDIWLNYANWNDTGPMSIDVDTDGDHKADKTITLNDETP